MNINEHDSLVVSGFLATVNNVVTNIWVQVVYRSIRAHRGQVCPERVVEGQALQQTGGDVGAGSPPRGLSNPFSWGCCETGDEETGGGLQPEERE